MNSFREASYPNLKSETANVGNVIAINIESERKLKEEKAKKFIKQANDIQHKLSNTNFYLLTNPHLRRQFNRFINGQVNFDINKDKKNQEFASFELRELIKRYEEIASNYLKLKAGMIDEGLLSEQEIKQIETNLSNAKTSNKKLYFFPAYQNNFEEIQAGIASHKEIIIKAQKNKIKKIKDNYKSNEDFRVKYFMATGVFSVAVIGLPFLLGGLLGVAIHKMINAIQIKYCEHKIATASSEAQMAVKLAKTNMKKDIMTASQQTQLNQTFFSLAKQCRKYEVESLRPDNAEKINFGFKFSK